jgi:hypothetical protein
MGLLAACLTAAPTSATAVGVDADLAAVSAAYPTLSQDTKPGVATTGDGNTLAAGVTLSGAGAQTTSVDADPNTPDGTTTVTGTDGTAPSGTLGNMSVTMPAATGTFRYPMQPDHTTGADTSTFDNQGFATSATSLPSTDAAVQSTADGTRLFTIIKGPNAPTQFTYHLNLPAGAVLLPATQEYATTDNMPAATPTDSSYVIELNGAIIGDIDAPWAKDANGAAVPTSYTLQGSDLIQTVSHQGAAYPVVADPKVSFGWYVYVRWNKAEAKAVNHIIAGAGASFLNAICYTVHSHQDVMFWCLSITAAKAAQISYIFKWAADHNQCVEVKFPYAPWPSARSYHC